jgi:microcompartment protein CcmL/EutN
MNALGMIETNSISAGMATADVMLKTASVELLLAQPVCPGKYIIIIKGTVAAVTSSVEQGRDECAECLIDSTIIPNIDNQVFAAITGNTHIPEKAAIGVVETLSIVSCIMMADTAVKSADIKLLEVRLGRGIGGKSFMLLAGDVSSVEYAIATVKNIFHAQEMIVKTTVIPAPHADLIKTLL